MLKSKLGTHRGRFTVGLLTLILLGGFLYQQFAAAQEVLVQEPAQSVEPLIIADEFYGYSFKVPGNWYTKMGVTADRWFFLSDPAAKDSDSLHYEARPEGFFTIQFDVAPVPDWVPEPETRDPKIDEHGNSTREDLLPYLPSGKWISVSGEPALVVEHGEEEFAEGDSEPFTRATSIYIITERIVYFFVFANAPGIDGDQSEYEKAINDILDSFEIDLNALVARQSVQSH